MKKVENVGLYVTIFALAVTVIGYLIIVLDGASDHTSIRYITAATTCIAVIPLVYTYTLLILKRINPKKYVFFSYAKRDTELASTIRKELDEALNRNSRYRYEILIGDDIPLGIDMSTGIEELIGKSEIIIALVSKEYVLSERCLIEFKHFDFEKQKVIPIVKSDYRLLTELPVDISNIKGVSLGTNITSVDITDLVKTLSKDIIKNQDK